MGAIGVIGRRVEGDSDKNSALGEVERLFNSPGTEGLESDKGEG
jgi:hypothetical protein